MAASDNHDTAGTGVREARARALLEMARSATFEHAATALLDELLSEAPQSRGAFLVLHRPGAEPRSHGRAAGGESIAESQFLLNHRAVRRALSGETTFQVDSATEEGGGTGPELFLTTEPAEGIRLVASVRRSLGAPRFTAGEAEILERLFSDLARGLARAIEGKREGRPPDDAAGVYHGIACRSAASRALVATIERIKDTDFSVCIMGESGSGKELVARAIHAAGRRRDRPFVAEGCSAITESLVESELFGHVKGAFTGADEDKDGLFVAADGGTLYLDEIGDMSPSMQRKLLRVIQEGTVRPVGGNRQVRVDVRLITSTNRNLEALIASGDFRADLYWRLNVIAVEVPPLRERREDLPDLIDGILKELQAEGLRVRPLSAVALAAALEYHWPGNVRQLQAVLRRAILECDGREVGKKELLKHVRHEGVTPWRGYGLTRSEQGMTIEIPNRPSFKELVGECEKAILLNALREFSWNKSEVTRALKIPRQTLYNKMDELAIRPPDSGTT